MAIKKATRRPPTKAALDQAQIQAVASATAEKTATELINKMHAAKSAAAFPASSSAPVPPAPAKGISSGLLRTALLVLFGLICIVVLASVVNLAKKNKKHKTPASCAVPAAVVAATPVATPVPPPPPAASAVPEAKEAPAAESGPSLKLETHGYKSLQVSVSTEITPTPTPAASVTPSPVSYQLPGFVPGVASSPYGDSFYGPYRGGNYGQNYCPIQTGPPRFYGGAYGGQYGGHSYCPNCPIRSSVGQQQCHYGSYNSCRHR